MKPNCIYFGHNGPLGKIFCKRESERFNIIGMSRSNCNHAHVNLTGDVTNTDFKSLFTSYGELGGIKHIIYAPNWCKWSKLEDLDDTVVRYGYDVGVFSLLRMLKVAASFKNEIESIVIVSSISAYGAWGTTQIAYGSMKASQVHIAKYASKILTPIVVNCIAPNSFPDKISTESVSDEIIDLLLVQSSGTIKVMR